MATVKSLNPQIVLLFSGKRKSGKDYVVRKLENLFNDQHLITIVTLSAPLKGEYAKQNNLNVDRLLDSSLYKENHRKDMIVWGESVRQQDPGYFCRKAIELANGLQFPVWIISDARRQSDVKFFLQEYGSKLKTVRINATEVVRKSREWNFTLGVDDAESECGLDSIEQWHWIINNNGDDEELMKILIDIKEAVLLHIS